MIAALPMYDRPATRGAYLALWSLVRDRLRARGISAPHGLDHDIAYNAVWDRDDLVLGHICNLPYRRRYRDRLTAIGASDYAIPGCAPGFYRSCFVVRRDDTATTLQSFHKARIVANARDSQSGYGVLTDLARAQGALLPTVTWTGSHDASVAAVLAGRADFAAIDAHTWDLMQADTPGLDGLRVIGLSPASPGQTFVTGPGRDPAPYLAALNDAIAGLSAPTRRILRLRGVVPLPASDYDLDDPASQAATG